MEANEERCPWCGTVISHEKFIQIKDQIREQEQKRLEEVKASMQKQMEAQFSQELEAAKKAAARQYQDDADKRIAAEREKSLQQLTLLQAAEAQARKQAQEAKESADAMRKSLEQQLEAERHAGRQSGKEEAQKEFSAAEAEHKKFREEFRQLQLSEAEARKQAQQAAQSKLDAEKSFSQRLEAETLAAGKRAKQETEALLSKEMDRRTTILQQEHQADLVKEKLESQKRYEAALKELEDAKHKLEEQKTANQLGDGAEVNLFETLRESFPGDRIERVPKGQAGLDVRHWVRHKGETCGQIVYESKNQQQPRTEWISKLREDQIDCGADHAILATTAWPKGTKELHVDDSGVILVHPARAVQIAHLLRQAMIEMHTRGLGQKERAGKTNRLYEFVRSNEYQQQFEHVQSLTDELLDVDVKEKKAHDKTWRERGQLLIKQRNALREIDTRVTAIIEGPDVAVSSAA